MTTVVVTGFALVHLLRGAGCGGVCEGSSLAGGTVVFLFSSSVFSGFSFISLLTSFLASTDGFCNDIKTSVGVCIMYVGMYVRTYVRTYVYVCVCMYVCVYVCMYVCMYVCSTVCVCV